MTKWEYLLVSLPTLTMPKSLPGDSEAVTMLNEQGNQGWEAVGLSTLSDGHCAVLFKRARVNLGHTSGGRL